MNLNNNKNMLILNLSSCYQIILPKQENNFLSDNYILNITMPDHQNIPKPLIPQTQSSENDYTAKNNQPFHYLKHFNSNILNLLFILI